MRILDANSGNPSKMSGQTSNTHHNKNHPDEHRDVAPLLYFRRESYPIFREIDDDHH